MMALRKYVDLDLVKAPAYAAILLRDTASWVISVCLTIPLKDSNLEIQVDLKEEVFLNMVPLHLKAAVTILGANPHLNHSILVLPIIILPMVLHLPNRVLILDLLLLFQMYTIPMVQLPHILAFRHLLLTIVFLLFLKDLLLVILCRAGRVVLYVDTMPKASVVWERRVSLIIRDQQMALLLPLEGYVVAIGRADIAS